MGKLKASAENFLSSLLAGPVIHAAAKIVTVPAKGTQKVYPIWM